MGDFADDCYHMASGEDCEEPKTDATPANVLADALNMMAVHYGMSDVVAARRALIDALGAVPRANADLIDVHGLEAERMRDRAEQAERELDRARADLRRIQDEAKDGSWFHRVVTDALSANADAGRCEGRCECGHPLARVGEDWVMRCVMDCAFQDDRDAEPPDG